LLCTSGSRQLLQAGSGCLTEAFLFIFSQSALPWEPTLKVQCTTCICTSVM